MRVGHGPLRIESADKWAGYHKKPRAVPVTEQNWSEKEVASQVVERGIARRFSQSPEAIDLALNFHRGLASSRGGSVSGASFPSSCCCSMASLFSFLQ